MTDTASTATVPSWTPSLSSSLSFDDQRSPYTRRGGSARDEANVRVFGAVEIESMRAKQSFSATLGTSTIIGFGGGMDVLSVRGSAFVRIGVSRIAKSGTRFVGADGTGSALNVAMMPIDLGIGLRFNHLSRDHTFVPYVGGGALFLHYQETTPAGLSADNTDIWKAGYQVFAGVDLRVAKTVTIAPEFEFRGVPNAIGTGGLSEQFGETDLGGLTFRVAVAFHLGGRR
jgi:opacity protein-like surface antigen